MTYMVAQLLGLKMLKPVEFYWDTQKKHSIAVWTCDSCKKEQKTRKSKFQNKVTHYCFACYQKSPERKEAAKKNVKNRRSFDGKENPNFKNAKKNHICPCGKSFEANRTRTHAKYCSIKCRGKYRSYGIKSKDGFRSSWEKWFAKWLTKQGVSFQYEPVLDIEKYSYRPDFFVPAWNVYFEVKGWWRDDAKSKFIAASKTYPLFLIDKEVLMSLGAVFNGSGSIKDGS